MERIRTLWQKCSSNIGFNVEDGRRITFWENRIGPGPLKDQFPDLFRLALLSDSTLATNRKQDGWNFNFRRHLNDWELERLDEIFGYNGIFSWIGTESRQAHTEWRMPIAKESLQ